MSNLSSASAHGIDVRMAPGNRLAMGAVMLAVALATLDTAIANTALPAIAIGLHATPSATGVSTLGA